MSTRKFKVGDKVSWSSQSQGSRTGKTGEVFRIIPAGARPDDIIMGCGWQREHESYVVNVMGKFYWPRVSALLKDTPE